MATLPPANVLLRAAQVAMEQDKPIYLDYYADSVEKKCCVGVQASGDKYLVKSNEEYTSTIENIFRCETCFIIATENSLYVVSADVPVKKILSSTSS